MAESDARAAILALLAGRSSEKTICPSEAARAISGVAWRDAMPMVHAAVQSLEAEKRIEVRQAGERREISTVVGAYRIGRVR